MLQQLGQLASELRGSLSLTLVTVCVSIFVVAALADLTGLWPRERTIATLGLSSHGLLVRGWIFQLVTSPLIHANVTHLAFNMLAVAFFGPMLERRLGRRHYVGLSCAAALTAGPCCLWASAGMPVVALGYSGVVYGLLLAQAWLFPGHRVAVFGVFPLRMRHAAWLLCAVELYLAITETGGTRGHWGHLAGAAAAAYLKWLGATTDRAAAARHAPTPGVPTEL